ncbi:MAG TPA: DUF5818 domain-containing protein [Kofleriaceae bacterium]|nr:DUF5818 domain-containing protein [Kofleriaceae bacterium]
MAKYTGTVQRSDLEGGHWLLVTADGDQYQLDGARDLVAGQKVEVEGKVDKEAFGFGMTGPILRVKKVTPKK